MGVDSAEKKEKFFWQGHKRIAGRQKKEKKREREGNSLTALESRHCDEGSSEPKSIIRSSLLGVMALTHKSNLMPYEYLSYTFGL